MGYSIRLLAAEYPFPLAGKRERAHVDTCVVTPLSVQMGRSKAPVITKDDVDSRLPP